MSFPRSLAEEVMDDPALAPETYAAVLRDLAQVNSVTMAARPTLAFLDNVVRRGERLKLLDVGYGDGDMLRRIARWAAKRGVQAELVGIDLNPRSEAIARADGPEAARDFLTRIRAELPSDEARRQFNEYLNK